ncbi:hypothetical protein [Streptomyces sp. NPDC088915]|uniref:hypothetical protein n=1 Tax=Streptomyces sp. NPDC088915 TaxID=3365912 RepID=UPI00382901B3
MTATTPGPAGASGVRGPVGAVRRPGVRGAARTPGARDASRALGGRRLPHAPLPTPGGHRAPYPHVTVRSCPQ